MTEAEKFQKRLEQVVEKAGGPGKLSKSAGISRRVLDQYRSGRSDPSRTKLVAIAKAANVSSGWLADGNGQMIPGQLEVKGTSIDIVRKFTWNIAATFWETLPRKTKPDEVADQFVETLDYLLSREQVNEDAASEVIQFGAERLKKGVK